MIRRLIRTAPVVALGIALAACSGSEAPPPPDANAEEAPIVENMGFENMIEPIAPPTATPTPTPTPDEPAPQADAQVQEDADAVGMTARVNRDEAPAPAPETAPVEEKK